MHERRRQAAGQLSRPTLGRQAREWQTRFESSISCQCTTGARHNANAPPNPWGLGGGGVQVTWAHLRAGRRTSARVAPTRRGQTNCAHANKIRALLYSAGPPPAARSLPIERPGKQCERTGAPPALMCAPIAATPRKRISDCKSQKITLKNDVCACSLGLLVCKTKQSKRKERSKNLSLENPFCLFN